MRPYTLLLSAAFASGLFAQDPSTEPRTLFGTGHQQENGGWGGPSAAFTEVMDKPALLTGLRGGWMIDHRFTLGAAGYGLVTNVPNEGYDAYLLEQGETLQRNSLLRLGYGGLLLEPVIGYKSPVHIALPILIGAGGCTYETSRFLDLSDSTRFDTWGDQGQAFFVIEPGLELEVNLVRLVRIGLGASYRYTSDIDLPATPTDALRGLNTTFSVKVGRF
jgi:hypothetical protein